MIHTSGEQDVVLPHKGSAVGRDLACGTSVKQPWVVESVIPVLKMKLRASEILDNCSAMT